MRKPRIQRTPNNGWTLVELLVAATLGLLLIAGIGKIYLAAKQSYDIQTSLSRLQETGRYVSELLTQDVRRAGYWGIMDISGATLTNNVSPAPNCNSASSNWGKMITEKIFGLNDESKNYNCINRLTGDVLTVRYGDPSSPTPCTTCTGLYIRTTLNSGDIETGPAGATSSTPTSDHALIAHAYYIAASTTARECGKTAAPAPFLPALDREYLIDSGSKIGRPRTEELTTGVEQLQFQYGVDTDGDASHSVNQYMNANEVSTSSNWPNVRSVRFWILIRDDCPESGYTDSNTYVMGDTSYTPGDGYRRALYSSSVSLRN